MRRELEIACHSALVLAWAAWVTTSKSAVRQALRLEMADNTACPAPLAAQALRALPVLCEFMRHPPFCTGARASALT
jgi:hypothetical protein